jgi:hypothetical protein
MPERIEPSTATMSEIGGTMALATLKYFSALPKLHLLLLKIGAACGSSIRYFGRRYCLFNGIYLQWWGHHGGGIYPQLTRQRDEFYPHLYGDYPHPWIFY